MPDPILFLVRRQRVNVEQNLPNWFFSAKAVERRSPPESTRVIGISPEVVEVSAPTHAERNMVTAVQQGCQRVAVAGKRSVAERRQGDTILCLYPGQRASALNLFEPQMRIVVRRRDGRPCVSGHGGGPELAKQNRLSTRIPSVKLLPETPRPSGRGLRKTVGRMLLKINTDVADIVAPSWLLC